MSTAQHITGRSAQWVRSNYNDVQEFPRHDDGEWYGMDLSDGLEATFRQARERGLIVQTGYEKFGEGVGRHTKNTYQTTQKLDAMRDAVKDRNTLPCGHSGFRKVGDDEYECCASHCDAVHDRATVAEVYLS